MTAFQSDKRKGDADMKKTDKVMVVALGAVAALVAFGACAKTTGGSKDQSSKATVSSVTTNDNGSVSRTFTESTVTTNGNMVTEHRRETRTNMDMEGNVLETSTSEYAQSYPVGDHGVTPLASIKTRSAASDEPAVKFDSFLGLKFGEVFKGTNFVTDASEPDYVRTTFTPKFFAKFGATLCLDFFLQKFPRGGDFELITDKKHRDRERDDHRKSERASFDEAEKFFARRKQLAPENAEFAPHRRRILRTDPVAEAGGAGNRAVIVADGKDRVEQNRSIFVHFPLIARIFARRVAGKQTVKSLGERVKVVFFVGRQRFFPDAGREKARRTGKSRFTARSDQTDVAEELRTGADIGGNVG